MPTIELDGDQFDLTDEQNATFQRLTEASIDPWKALQIAKGDFEDIDPAPEPEETP